MARKRLNPNQWFNPFNRNNRNRCSTNRNVNRISRQRQAARLPPSQLIPYYYCCYSFTNFRFFFNVQNEKLFFFQLTSLALLHFLASHTIVSFSFCLFGKCVRLLALVLEAFSPFLTGLNYCEIQFSFCCRLLRSGRSFGRRGRNKPAIDRTVPSNSHDAAIPFFY